MTNNYPPHRPLAKRFRYTAGDRSALLFRAQFARPNAHRPHTQVQQPAPAAHAHRESLGQNLRPMAQPLNLRQASAQNRDNHRPVENKTSSHGPTPPLPRPAHYLQTAPTTQHANLLTADHNLDSAGSRPRAYFRVTAPAAVHKYAGHNAAHNLPAAKRADHTARGGVPRQDVHHVGAPHAAVAQQADEPALPHQRHAALGPRLTPKPAPYSQPIALTLATMARSQPHSPQINLPRPRPACRLPAAQNDAHCCPGQQCYVRSPPHRPPARSNRPQWQNCPPPLKVQTLPQNPRLPPIVGCFG